MGALNGRMLGLAQQETGDRERLRSRSGNMLFQQVAWRSFTKRRTVAAGLIELAF